MASKAGITLRRQLDDSDVQNLRARLRQPKKAAPGWSHSLHHLWDAYVALETEHLALCERVREAKRLLT